MAVTVQTARTDAEREQLYAFRYQVYVRELGLSPPAADHGRKRLWDPLDDVGVSHVLLDDGEVVGSLRMIFLGDVADPAPLIEKFGMEPAIAAMGRSAICTTSRFIIHPRLRMGLAIYRLMAHAYEDAAGRGIRLNYGDCSPHLLPFYERLGYRRYTEAYNDTSYGIKVLILMLGRDQQRFAQMRSPLAGVAARFPDDPEARLWFERTYPRYLGLESAAFLPEGVFFDLLRERVPSDPLHSIGLLHGLDRAEADRFLARATLVRATGGDRIVREGETGDSLFVILSGLAEVTLDEAPDRPVAVLGAGDTFGEVGFLTARPRIASVVARAPCELVVLSGDFLRRFIESEPATAAKVLLNLSRTLASRLAVTTRLAVTRA
jgi:CRP-like cAMP-binding protein/N-acyl-L-homoserine lactone synthetase